MQAPTLTRSAYQCLRWLISALTLGLLLACGGGGGGPSTPPSRFEAVTINGVAGVQDNTTGLVWARQLGPQGLPSPSTLPAAKELLYFADSNKLLEDPLFSFLDSLRSEGQSPYVAVSESNETGTVWVVDLFERPGRLTKLNAGERVTTPPGLHDWYKLSGRSLEKSGLTQQSDGTVQSDGLLWQLCSAGARFSGGACVDQARAMTYQEAKAFAAQQASVGWRLPSKQELQELMALTNGSTARSLMREPFNQLDAIANTTLLPYWTGSLFSPDNSVWVVNFSARGNNGGINTVEVDVQDTDLEPRALVRLVRNR